MSPQDRGRLGGRATVQRYGREHMRKIGKLGFDALVKKLGVGRSGAVKDLQRSGRLAAPRDLSPDQLRDLEREVGLDDTQDDEIPY